VGRFITLDGVDGGGKSTQVQRLQESLLARGCSCRTFRDPGSTRLGEALREILLHRHEIPLAAHAEMLLYMASRAQLVAEVLRPALEECDFVITDRYLLANVVYQGVAGGLPPEEIWQVGRVATGGLAPDLTIVLDLPIETAAARIDRTRDRLESRGEAYFQRVREGFLQEHRHAGGPSVVIDASQSVDRVHEQIVAAVAHHFGDSGLR
jgi:dTMP kinase